MHSQPIPISHPSSPCPAQVTGAIPRRPTAAIVVALQQPSDGAIVAIAPFYMGCTGGRNARVVTPRHHGVPRRGWVGAGRRLGEAIRLHVHHYELLTLMRRFTATTYNGAFLLHALGGAGYPASPTAVATTLRNYDANLTTYSTPPSLASVATRSLHVSPFTRGERVFARLGEDWFEARVRIVHRDGTLSIGYVDESLDSDDPGRARKPEVDVRPDVVHVSADVPPPSGPPSAHPKDPEDDVDESPSRIAEHLSMGGAADRVPGDRQFTFLDRLGELGEYTALLEVIFGHEDHFGNDAGQLIENKLLVPRGPTHAMLRLTDAVADGCVPIGALAIPRYKAATLIGAMQDVELHELHGVFHGGRSGAAQLAVEGGGAAGSSSGAVVEPEDKPPSGSEQGHSKQAQKRQRRAARRRALREATYTSPRACWFRDADDADGRCHVEGVGVADWLSKFY